MNALELCKISLKLCEILNHGALVVNKEGIIYKCNDRYATLIGISKTKIEGNHVSTLVSKELISHISILDVIESKKPVTIVSSVIIQNKELMDTTIPYLNEDGSISFIISVLQDLSAITEFQLELRKAQLQQKENPQQPGKLNYLYNNTQIVGNSTRMVAIKELIMNIAPTDATILITGETGCGKEVVARAIHRNSNRRKHKYIKINCAAIPETLIESEMFGYEKGAFTGALNKYKPGLFEIANEGTILLDEIGEMPYNLQSKLLRVLQEKEVIRLGGSEPIATNVRIIASTNQNIQYLIKNKKFREDLYYRLNVVPIELPPLRERKEDIPMLANMFLEKFNKKYGQKKFLTMEAIHILNAYNWPGNVRELENIVERLVVVNNDNEISSAVLQLLMKRQQIFIEPREETKIELDTIIGDMEKRLIQNALRKYKNTYKAAYVLGITQSKLCRRMKTYGLKIKK